MGIKLSSQKHATGSLVESFDDHRESVNCMALSEDKSVLVTGSEDFKARMWYTKAEKTECIGVLK